MGIAALDPSYKYRMDGVQEKDLVIPAKARTQVPVVDGLGLGFLRDDDWWSVEQIDLTGFSWGGRVSEAQPGALH